MSSLSAILLLAKFPVPKAISRPFSSTRVLSATNKFLDLNFTLPIAVIFPELTGLVIFILKEVVNTKASVTIEFTAKKQMHELHSQINAHKPDAQINARFPNSDS